MYFCTVVFLLNFNNKRKDTKYLIHIFMSLFYKIPYVSPENGIINGSEKLMTKFFLLVKITIKTLQKSKQFTIVNN